MATKTRSLGGCWTCRLRRKKCDEGWPACQGCASLEIDCLYSLDKPEWMDGAGRQKEKADSLKKEVKRKSAHRRERRHLHGLEVRLESLDASLTDESDSTAAKNPICTTDSSSPSTGAQDCASKSASDGAQTDSSLSAPSPSLGEPSGGSTLPGLNLGETLSQEGEAYATMFYLDYVFPFLFPFYRAPFVDVGRGWLLILLTKNKALFHSALSLAAYFHGIVRSHTDEAAHQCQTHAVEELHEQQGLALQWLQREMQDIVTRGVKANLADANRVMASIIQLMTSEAAIANPGNWTMHLDAATELFNEIMEHHAATETGRFCFMLVLLHLGPKPFSWTPKNHPWGSDQATLRFFTAQLLLFDTIASTSLQQPPRLQQWHDSLLVDLDEETKKSMPDLEKEQTMPHINLHEFVGIQNWVIYSIAEIAALDSWKKEMRKNGALSVTQLVTRAAAIQERLCASQRTSDILPHRPPPLPQYFAGGAPSAQPLHGPLLNTQIWGQAAVTYLGVVLSGWQPSSPEIRHSVAQTIEMLRGLPSPDCLRTLVWPFTVTGCLAAPDQEYMFRDMVEAMGLLKVFGTIREGLAIMEHVWKRRAEIDENPDQWDLAACLNCLHQPALLI